MGKRFIISENERNQIGKMYGLNEKQDLINEQNLWDKIKNFFPAWDVKKDETTNKTEKFCGPNCQGDIETSNKVIFQLPECFQLAVKNSKFPRVDENGNPAPGTMKQFSMENISMTLKIPNSSLPPNIEQFSGLVFFDVNKKPFCKVSYNSGVEYNYPLGVEKEPTKGEVGQPETPTR